MSMDKSYPGIYRIMICMCGRFTVFACANKEATKFNETIINLVKLLSKIIK